MTLRLMTLTDIPAAQRLRALAQWNQTDADWRLLLKLAPESCFVADIDGLVAGTATAVRFDPAQGPGSFGWIGMLLVDPAQRRGGIGSMLLKQCIAFLDQHGVETIKLDATPLGKKVYDTLGFRTEYTLERYEGMAQPSTLTPEPIEPLSTSDMNELSAFDAPIFGARRDAFLDAWRKNIPECAFVARMDGVIAGYVLARRGERFQHIGPVVGKTPALCESLLRAALQPLEGQPVVVDLLNENPWTRPIAERCGLRAQRPLIRMFRGPNTAPGRPEQVLAICCPELG